MYITAYCLWRLVDLPVVFLVYDIVRCCLPINWKPSEFQKIKSVTNSLVVKGCLYMPFVVRPLLYPFPLTSTLCKKKERKKRRCKEREVAHCWWWSPKMRGNVSIIWHFGFLLIKKMKVGIENNFWGPWCELSFIHFWTKIWRNSKFMPILGWAYFQ